MLQLRRVRLDSVGHPNARFAPLELRLIGDDQHPTHTVLWLRNGGGKSSLLNLIFAVVRPNRREFLGVNDDGKDRRLSDYVLAGDTSHVCLEWGVPGTRTPALVTGMTLEWRDRVRAADDTRLRRLWYAFVPSDHRPPGLLELAPTLTFDTLPFAEDDRRLALTAFRDRLRAISGRDGSLRLVTPTSQTEWRRELEHHDLDPEVLRYQLQMNREEGGASELFKRRCRTESDFVDLLIELAVADEQSDRVADVYTRYADELARRPDVERNQAFLDGTLKRLQPVVTALQQRDAAEAELRAVLAEVAARVTALQTAAADARARSADHDVRAERRRDEAAHLDARSRQQRAQAAAVRRVSADMAVGAAERQLAAATAALERAAAQVATTTLLEPLARRRRLDDEIAMLDRRLHADRPALAADLEHAQRALSQRLTADERDQRAAADSRQAQADACLHDADATDQAVADLITERGRVEQTRATLAERRAAAGQHREHLIGRGLVDAGEQISAAHARHDAQLRGLRRTRARQAEELEQIDSELRDTYTRLTAADERHSSVSARLAAAERDHVQLTAAAEALAGDDRLRELAETSAIDVWQAAPLLLDRLGRALDDTDRRLADDAVEAAADRAALATLASDGLLPVRRVVQQVIDVLQSAGVEATPGWRMLAEEVPSEQRALVVTRAPHLVDGVVVRSQVQLEAARHALATLPEPLPAVVVVGDAGAITATHPGTDTVLVAPVDAALYDRAHAEQARARRRDRLMAADRRHAKLVTGRGRDAALADRLRRLLDSFPPDRRSAVTQAVDQARAAGEAIDDDRRALNAQLAHLHERRRTLRSAAVGCATDIERVEAVMAQIDPAALEDGDAPDRELSARARELDSTVEAGTLRARELRRSALDHAMAASRHTELADALRRQRADVQGGQTVAGGTVPAEPAEVLLERVHMLQAGLEAHRDDNALRERRRSLLERRAEVGRELAAADDERIAAATSQLSGPDGASQQARAAATRAAEWARDAALGARASARERLRATRAARDLLPPPEPLPSGFTPPAAPADAEQTEQQLLTAADQTQREAAAARADVDHARQRARDETRNAEAYEHLIELLAVELRDREAPVVRSDAAASPGSVPTDPQQARMTIDALRRRLVDQIAATERSARTVAQSAAEVRRFVTDLRFSSLDGPLRARLASDPVAVINADPTLIEQLSLRLEQCGQKLAELSSHRRLLVREIAASTQRGLWLLRQADQVSVLPDGFGEWSNQRFLQIRFATPAVDDDLVARLEDMVDRLIDEGVRPSGLPLLQRATHAAVGVRGFSVRILKPNPALRPQRVPVTDLATFSGGEQLTAAILLYCTLARLRAQSRQTSSTAGLLTLDNPIGKSSNVTLLQLQRRVADAMGVQLIYTTAVDDREAVGVLPHWVRLRNERRDVRTGNQHVELADPAFAADGDADMAQVSATHLWRRVDAPVSGVP